MNKLLTVMMITFLVQAGMAPAYAQHFDRGRPSLTLFTGLNYTGQTLTLSTDSPDLREHGFDEAAGSLLARGEWQVCLDPFYGTRCRIYNDRVPDLRSFRGRISSARYVGGRAPNGYTDFNDLGSGGNLGHKNEDRPTTYSGRFVAGRGTVFFPGLVVDGRDRQQLDADRFCASHNLSRALYAGRSQTGELEDVLCKY
ncbi:beta/gamma crystallin-related protein [Candidatus Phycosocius spiralis]|uniref:Beta/gamma crystallin 'Greek key' domain-containing protein n=1 Tax=Candidatus Phycosocius spiralis TaxID=2815099 RepID=A0ABQ4PS40_9PROT|nr:beta/gamma crystallin-related protein [Candidatus Phycosocius spiralis]GIU65850.1 hypothetical protein PsB1_0004 [Candidatus Phycosocius spiralis]